MSEKSLSDKELYRAIVAKYGEDWDFKKVSLTDPLIVEFIKRLECGV